MLKKKIFIPVLTLIFVFSCLSGTAVFAEADTASVKGAVSYGTTDFEDGKIMAGFKREGGTDTGDKEIKVVEDPSNSSNNVLKYPKNIGGVYKIDALSINAGLTVVSFDFYQKVDYVRTNSADFVRYKIGGGYKNFMNISGTNKITISSNKNTVTPNTWYSVKGEFDFKAKTCKMYFGEKGSMKYVGETSCDGTLTDFQFLFPDSDFYIDNFRFDNYTLKNSIAASETAADVLNAIEFYRSNKLITTSFNLLLEDDKAAVAAKILSDKDTYTDDESVITALSNLVSGYGDGSTLYYKWNFNESKSLNDYVNGTEFMMGNKSYNGEGAVTLVADTVNPEKTVAKIDFSKPGEKLTSTTTLKNDLSNIKYVVYDITARKDGNKQVIFQTRNADASRINLLTIFTNDTSWGTYKIVYSKDGKSIKQYKLNNSVWGWYSDPTTVSVFEGNDIRLNHTDDVNNKYGNLYFSSLEVKGYKDFYAEINDATSANVLRVVDAFKDMHVITLPAAYASMDDNAKTELAAALKSKTWTSDDEVITFISCELSDNELVAISDVTEDNTLKSAEFAINKDGITASGAIAVFASYGADNTLIGVSTKDVTSDFAKYSVVSVSDINLDVTGAAKIKYMLINDLESLMPITASLTK
ncbi:MAG: hypothetical protein SOW78_00665 [Clostridia bacterium]|nr:hypothetical protein [Clostridia bacterium]